MKKAIIVSLYVGTYRKYNEGNLFGKWMDLTEFVDAEEFLDACYELHKDEADPEFMFQDCEGLPDALYCESCSTKNLEEIFEYIDKCAEFGQKMVDAVIESGEDLDEVENFYYLCEDDYFNRDEQIGIAYIDQLGGVVNLDRDTLERYFDFESYGRDLKHEMRIIQSGRSIYYSYY
jgi:antirestriction protein